MKLRVFVFLICGGLFLELPSGFAGGSDSRQWLLLGHYRKTIWGGYRSELDGEGFFFSPKGKTDPDAELAATIEAMRDPSREVGRLRLNPQCAFPARRDYVSGVLRISLPEIECPKLRDFIDSFSAASVTLVFSSALPNNPGSMFGHTFLRFNRNDNPTHQDLLAQGVNYAAVVPEDEASLRFMVLGLFGGYRGRFSAQPYYEKVNEYVRSESRDLWEYDLSLSSEETQTLLKHIWELETNSHFDYYFFDENCSYQILSAIEVAKPDWNLSISGLYVIPAMTIRKLSRISGGIVSVKSRPSLRRQLLTRLATLHDDERRQVEAIVRDSDFASGMRSSTVLETIAIYEAYEKQRRGSGWSDLDQSRYLKILSARSRLGTVEKAARLGADEVEESERPDRGHGTYRVGLAHGVISRWGQFESIHFRTAYHDLLNRDVGYPRFSHIEFPALTVRRYHDSKWALDSLNLVSLTSLPSITALDSPLSWRLNLEVYAPKDFGCRSCTNARGRAGFGIAKDSFNRRLIGYSLLSMNVEAGRQAGSALRGGPEFEAGAIWSWRERYKIQPIAALKTDLFQNLRPKIFGAFELNQALSVSDVLELRLLTSIARKTKEATLNVFVYF